MTKPDLLVSLRDLERLYNDANGTDSLYGEYSQLNNLHVITNSDNNSYHLNDWERLGDLDACFDSNDDWEEFKENIYIVKIDFANETIYLYDDNDCFIDEYGDDD